METNVKKRNGNIELLRMISMCMIVMLHALGKGNLLVNPFGESGANAWIAWVLECLSISAVNIFILISGYFLIKSEFKIGRLIELVLEVLFYAVLSYVCCIAFGVDTGIELNVYNSLFAIFPLHMNMYWFMTAYIIVYMLQPIFKVAAEHLSEKQYRNVLIVLLVYECVFKSILPVRLEEDERGYNVLWFVIVFLLGGYIRYYGFKFFTKVKRGWISYFIGTLLVFVETIALKYIVFYKGHLTEIEGLSLEYNNVFVLLAAIGIFAAFINMKPMKEKVSSVVCALSPMSLGVYLFHENISLRYNWQKWLGIKDSLSCGSVLFFVKVLGAILAVYAIGTFIDFVRIRIFGLVKVWMKR